VITPPIKHRLPGIDPLIKNLPAIPNYISKFFIPVGLAPMPRLPLSQHHRFGSHGCTIFYSYNFEKKNAIRIFFSASSGFFFFFSLLYGYRHEMGGQAYDYLIHRLYLPSVGFTIAFDFVSSPGNGSSPRNGSVFTSIRVDHRRRRSVRHAGPSLFRSRNVR